MYYLYNPQSLLDKKEGKYYTLDNLKDIKLFDFTSLEELEDFWSGECIYQEWWPVYKILNNSFKIINFDSEDEAKQEVLRIENRIIDKIK